MKKNVFFGLLGLMVLFGFIGCGGDDDPKVYNVTIDTLENGSITVSPTSGTAGTEIILTVNPDNLYKLKTGTLKYGATAINETSLKFNLPASNVTVSAEFESFLIGNWIQGIGDQIWTFFSNIFYTKNIEDKFNQKGTWIIENPNKIILTVTHYYGIGVEIIENLPIGEEELVFEYIFEFISNSEWRIIEYDIIFTKIE